MPITEKMEPDPCVLASKILADHGSGVCIIVHTINRRHNHSTHWFDNMDAREVLNESIDITNKATAMGFTWSFYVLKSYDKDTGKAICQDTTESFNNSLEAAKRIKEVI